MELHSEEKVEEEFFSYYIIYCIFNGNYQTFLGKYKDRTELYKVCIENGVFITHLNQLTEESFIKLNKVMTERQIKMVNAPKQEESKIISLHKH